MIAVLILDLRGGRAWTPTVPPVLALAGYALGGARASAAALAMLSRMDLLGAVSRWAFRSADSVRFSARHADNRVELHRAGACQD